MNLLPGRPGGPRTELASRAGNVTAAAQGADAAARRAGDRAEEPRAAGRPRAAAAARHLRLAARDLARAHPLRRRGAEQHAADRVGAPAQLAARRDLA